MSEVTILNRKALHTAARRYCMERSLLLRQRYCKLRESRPEGGARDSSGAYSDEELFHFPRYNVLDAILPDVERFVPDDFSTLAEARELLVAAGQTAHSVFTQPPQEKVSLAVMTEERELFVTYIQNLSEYQLTNVAPLPYRRVLSYAERRRLRRLVDERWGTRDGYWYPINGAEPPPGVLVFQANYFHRAIPAAMLQSIVARRGISRLWQLREDGIDCEIDLALLQPFYSGAEGYWTSEAVDWLIYASHESSITIGGEWLLTDLKDVWPEWQQRLYTSYSYE